MKDEIIQGIAEIREMISPESEYFDDVENQCQKILREINFIHYDENEKLSQQYNRMRKLKDWLRHQKSGNLSMVGRCNPCPE